MTEERDIVARLRQAHSDACIDAPMTPKEEWPAKAAERMTGHWMKQITPQERGAFTGDMAMLITAARADALEEAARVCDAMPSSENGFLNDPAKCAAAIRALKQ